MSPQHCQRLFYLQDTRKRGLEQLPNKAPEEPWLPLPQHGKGFMEPSYSATPKIPAPRPPSQIEVSLLDMTLYNQHGYLY